MIHESTKTELQRHGTSVLLDGSPTYGTFANGDHWVVGPVDAEVNTSALYSGSSLAAGTPFEFADVSRVKHGAMLNPDPRNGSQGYDSLMGKIPFDASKRFTRGRLVPGDKLVMSVSHDNETRPQLARMAVLTVVEAPVPAGVFRPGYCSADRSVLPLHVGMIRWDRLGNDLAPLASMPSLESLAKGTEEPFVDHIGGWVSQHFCRWNGSPHYGRDYSNRLGQAALAVNLKGDVEDKRPVVVNLIQLGLDLWSVATHGGNRHWMANGGHAQGRKFPILFAAAMMGFDVGVLKGISAADIWFGEDMQTFYVEKDANGAINGGDGKGYTDAHVGLAEYGIRHSREPERDDASWGAPYRGCCTANSWAGWILAAHIMEPKCGIRTGWGHPALFDYMDRHVDFGRSVRAPEWQIILSSWVREHWDNYRGQV